MTTLSVLCLTIYALVYINGVYLIESFNYINVMKLQLVNGNLFMEIINIEGKNYNVHNA